MGVEAASTANPEEAYAVKCKTYNARNMSNELTGDKNYDCMAQDGP